MVVEKRLLNRGETFLRRKLLCTEKKEKKRKKKKPQIVCKRQSNPSCTHPSLPTILPFPVLLDSKKHGVYFSVEASGKCATKLPCFGRADVVQSSNYLRKAVLTKLCFVGEHCFVHRID